MARVAMELYHTRGIILQDPTIDASRNFDRTIAFGMAVMANQKNKLNEKKTRR